MINEWNVDNANSHDMAKIDMKQQTNYIQRDENRYKKAFVL